MNVSNQLAILGVFKYFQRWGEYKEGLLKVFVRKWQSVHCILEWSPWHGLDHSRSRHKDIGEEDMVRWLDKVNWHTPLIMVLVNEDKDLLARQGEINED